MLLMTTQLKQASNNHSRHIKYDKTPQLRSLFFAYFRFHLPLCYTITVDICDKYPVMLSMTRGLSFPSRRESITTKDNPVLQASQGRHMQLPGGSYDASYLCIAYVCINYHCQCRVLASVPAIRLLTLLLNQQHQSKNLTGERLVLSQVVNLSKAALLLHFAPNCPIDMPMVPRQLSLGVRQL